MLAPFVAFEGVGVNLITGPNTNFSITGSTFRNFYSRNCINIPVKRLICLRVYPNDQIDPFIQPLNP